MKSSGATWCAHYAGTLHDMGFRASYADPDVWMAKAYKKKGTTVNPDGTHSKGVAYYQYIFVYVDDISVRSESPQEIIQVIGKAYRLKEDSITEPKS